MPTKKSIESLIDSYSDALDKSDVNKMLMLFTDNGILMPPNAPPAMGQQQLKKTYKFLFDSAQLNVRFSIEDLVVSGEYAFVQTNSKGIVLSRSTGQTAMIENKELFILRYINETWKISKYMFNQNKTK